MTSAAEQDQRKPEADGPGEAGGEPAAERAAPPQEIGGPAGPEPTRFGDWERAGRCVDF